MEFKVINLLVDLEYIIVGITVLIFLYAHNTCLPKLALKSLIRGTLYDNKF